MLWNEQLAGRLSWVMSGPLQREAPTGQHTAGPAEAGTCTVCRGRVVEDIWETEGPSVLSKTEHEVFSRFDNNAFKFQLLEMSTYLNTMETIYKNLGAVPQK